MGNLFSLLFLNPKSQQQNHQKKLIQFIDAPALTKRQRNLLFDHFHNVLDQLNDDDGNSFYNTVEEFLQFEKISLNMYLMTKKKKIKYIDIIDIAFLIGDPALIEYVLLMSKTSLDSILQRKAIHCGNISTLNYLEQRGIPINSFTLSCAAEIGCLKILKYCVDRGIDACKSTLDDAALYGHMDIIKYLIHEKHILPDRNTLDCTIIGSRLSSHHNIQANKYIFDLLYRSFDNNVNTLCLR